MPEPVPPTSGPPLPTLGTDGFASRERQPWQLPVERELFTRPDMPAGMFLGAVCANNTADDHRRCLSRIAWWVSQEFAGWGAFVIAVVMVKGYIQSNSALREGFAALIVLLALFLLARHVLSHYAFARLADERANSAPLALLANRDAVHLVAGVAVMPMAWATVRVVREVHGDLFVKGRVAKKSGWLYVPRRAFADESSARLFADALRTLARSKGDPAALSAEVRATFPPPYPL